MWTAHLVLQGHSEIQNAPNTYHPAWDVVSVKAGKTYKFEIKTDTVKSTNLFIPFQEKDWLGKWKYSGVLHPELEADTWV